MAYSAWKGARHPLIWFWRWFFCSFGGFLLEVAFARATRSPKRDRKCFLLFPLCPVYGFAAVLILAMTEPLRPGSPGVLFLGFACATCTEYAMDLFYQYALGVRFWDYTNMPFHIRGRVCLPFSLAWAVLSLLFVRLGAPALDRLIAALPAALNGPAVILTAADAAVSCAALHRQGTTEALRWYAPHST